METTVSISTDIYKHGDSQNLKNYRPIAVLHNISKTFERVILNRIIEYCETKNNLRLSQYFLAKPFHKGHNHEAFV